jgi:acetolactate synthase regulatory subunit
VDNGPVEVVERDTGPQVQALDASAIVAGADCRLDLTVDGARIHIGALTFGCGGKSVKCGIN